MEFWVGWELWQKMCSVLGCLIVVVLIYGFVILGYNKWTLRKHAAVEEQERMERRCLVMEDEEKDNIPFGARAIESGIQVDGIWISGKNTPTNSPAQPGTPAASRRTSSTINTSSQETLKPPPITLTACDGDTPRFYSERQGLQPHAMARGYPSGTVEADRLSANGEYLRRHETTESERSRYDYTAYQTYLQPERCGSPVDYPVSAYATPDEGQDISGIPLGILEEGFEPDYFGSQQGYESSGRMIQSPSRPAPAQRLNSRSSSEQIKLNPAENLQLDENREGGLDSLQAHRRTHAAETGQLGSTRGDQAGVEGYSQSVHPRELAEKLAQVIQEGT
ncbi:hypothetical protein FQN54_001393 [Arachnomyces sp. PD_36]|nr:hypothetical protein FQN54_001393 [Arachnomyces sp. PD_36]